MRCQWTLTCSTATRLVVLLFALPTANVGAQRVPIVPPSDSSGARSVRFLIVDANSGQPVEGAEIKNSRSGAVVTTSALGTASLMLDAASSVAVRKIGFQIATLPADRINRDSATTRIELARMTTLPASLIRDSAHRFISPGLRDFEERRRTGLGHYITGDQIRKEEYRSIASLVSSSVPGVRMVTSGNAVFLRGRNCFPSVYLDGTVLPVSYEMGNLNPKTGEPIIRAASLATFSLTQIGAIEYYTVATLPSAFNVTGNACGALLLWSREK